MRGGLGVRPPLEQRPVQHSLPPLLPPMLLSGLRMEERKSPWRWLWVLQESHVEGRRGPHRRKCQLLQGRRSLGRRRLRVLLLRLRVLLLRLTVQ